MQLVVWDTHILVCVVKQMIRIVHYCVYRTNTETSQIVSLMDMSTVWNRTAVMGNMHCVHATSQVEIIKALNQVVFKM